MIFFIKWPHFQVCMILSVQKKLYDLSLRCNLCLLGCHWNFRLHVLHKINVTTSVAYSMCVHVNMHPKMIHFTGICTGHTFMSRGTLLHMRSQSKYTSCSCIHIALVSYNKYIKS